jgi:S-adenosylmethionine/arginine decarboxylase-like enzyme
MQREIESVAPDDAPAAGGGIHLLGEWLGCKGPRPLLEKAAQLRALCIAAASDAGVPVVGDQFHRSKSSGIAGTVLSAQSHVTIHTWPERDAVIVDVFIGAQDGEDHRMRARELYETLRDRFAPAHENFLQVRCCVPA